MLCAVYEFCSLISVDLYLVREVTYFWELIFIRTVVKNIVGEVTTIFIRTVVKNVVGEVTT